MSSSKEINFLSKRRLVSDQLEQQDRKWYRWSLVCVTIVIIYLLFISALSFWLSYRFGQLNSEIVAIKNSISQKKDRELGYIATVNRLKMIAEIFSIRSNKQKAIEFFANLLGPQVFIETVDFKEGANVLSIRYNSTHVFSLEQTLNLFEQQNITNFFPDVSSSNLNRSEDGSYSFTLNINLASKKKN